MGRLFLLDLIRLGEKRGIDGIRQKTQAYRASCPRYGWLYPTLNRVSLRRGHAEDSFDFRSHDNGDRGHFGRGIRLA